MTEDEAKTKWCPFSRALGTLSKPVDGFETVVAFGPNNRGYQMGGAQPNCMCIGSACMAWRPQNTAEFKARAETAYRRDGTRLTSNEGFCGLAGVPS